MLAYFALSVFRVQQGAPGEAEEADLFKGEGGVVRMSLEGVEHLGLEGGKRRLHRLLW